jgi:hypothetical protein
MSDFTIGLRDAHGDGMFGHGARLPPFLRPSPHAVRSKACDASAVYSRHDRGACCSRRSSQRVLEPAPIDLHAFGDRPARVHRRRRNINIREPRVPRRFTGPSQAFRCSRSGIDNAPAAVDTRPSTPMRSARNEHVDGAPSASWMRGALRQASVSARDSSRRAPAPTQGAHTCACTIPAPARVTERSPAARRSLPSQLQMAIFRPRRHRPTRGGEPARAGTRQSGHSGFLAVLGQAVAGGQGT